MRRKTLAAAVAVSAALALGGASTQAASAAPAGSSQNPGKAGNPGKASLKTATKSLHKYDDADILRLLLAAQGPAARANPELVKILGFSESKPHTDDRALDEIIAGYLEYNPKFHQQTAKPLQSGDPERVNEALRTFSTSFNEFLAEKAEAAPGQPGEFQAQARGWFYMGAYVAVYANAVAAANAAVYANVGVATNALATLVIVTWYLEDGSPVGSDFEHDNLIKTLTEALA